ncbi:hypothetical protein [Lysobacter solisilvae (ex Woo and Kim 2020)]|uniref:Uncharacterized protein n=1 Tax=Agrilutibacter terrestris TaxID=2865112 RepID=A0A7H0FZK4_9GAMM|nr:hypothetical protein [Lysobacter terrestris]QNP41470.1 hypothetical protein H8B22_04410 [Lysobacter terrestris]
MALSKTERARAALHAHAGAGLSLAERRVLILCDGQRNRDDLVALLGAGALSIIERLLQDGYLALESGATAVPRLATSAGQPVEATPAAPAPIVSVAPPARATSRRSLAASKMYLVDMLQLQRDPESVSLRAEIQTSPSEDELVYRMMKGLHHLQAVAAASYARRVGDRLAEILPEQHVSRLDQARAAWLQSAAAVA